MKRMFPTELVISMFSLLIAFILVHASYVAVIRPNAETFLAEEKASMAIDPNYVPQHSASVVVKDFEQEACFVLMLWAFAILGIKMRNTYQQKQQLDRDFVGLPEGAVITPSDTNQISKQIRRLPEKMKEYLLARVLLSALDRFGSTKNIQDASTEVLNLCEEESERLESELSIIRYIAWAIPSIGFIGTVRGIGNALAQAHRAVEGDITGVTQNLGVAFNSTFIALLISIILMFVVHQIQLMQERLVLNTQRYCGKWLISRLTV
jgi:biopolymer transport protein ExbB/TolQ|tara:strand:+ start:119 stop:913 length:795 start_codon:yes stop_codon:yes gene_type:complete